MSGHGDRAGTAGFGEFVILIALIISMVALSIDTMLPALPDIVRDLAVRRSNDGQYVITVFFAGMALGQVLFGPLSDAVGRRPAILSGFCVFAAGSLISLTADGFDAMLLGRFMQGFGAAGPRIVSIAMVRDLYRGREMARVMSLAMTVFILVPIFAPGLGQVILWIFHWRAIFVLFLVLALAVSAWFWRRQRESLAPQNRIPLSPARLLLDTAAVLRNRQAFGYTLAMGLVFGAFLGYLSSSQQILQVQYELYDAFPLYFGILACAVGCASLANAQLVMRFGMQRLSTFALAAICILSALFLAPALAAGGQPALHLLMLYLFVCFFFFGILFGNLNALAMEPLGHIAGLGSAVVGSVSTLISVGCGIVIADAYDQTVLPLLLGFAGLGAAALLVMRWTARGGPLDA